MPNEYKPSLAEVGEMAAEGNMVAIYRDLPADMETPVSLFLKLSEASDADNGLSFLLDSVVKGEQVGRYSFIGVHPPMTVVAYGDQVTIGGVRGTVLEQKQGDPFEIVKGLMAGRRPVAQPELPSFTGGVVGYFGYDTVRFIEKLPATANDDLGVPDMALFFADNLIIFDHVRHRITVLATMRIAEDSAANRIAYADAVARVDQIVTTLRQPLAPPSVPDTRSDAVWQSNFTQDAHEENIRTAKEHIAAGDIFQVVLSQRLSRDTDADPFTIYRALRMGNPSPYMYFLNFAGAAGIAGEPIRVIGSSPEMHVQLSDETALLHPIAGTRWRGNSVEEDDALADELLNDPKERAEHVMLVDLGRNDLGRVCEYGTVNVPQMMAVERYSHVMHIVSDVRGRIMPEHDAYSLLRATFPAGTVSGAPKVRAMEIIEKLEGSRRALYAGAVGYIANDGNMDTCITIRTITMVGKTCHLQAGGGIVADSDPTAEYNESLNKARALAVAVEKAEGGEL